MNVLARQITITKRNGAVIEFYTKHDIESTVAALCALANRGNNFAASLLQSQRGRRGLSGAQTQWALKLAEDFNPTSQAPVAPTATRELPTFAGLLAWFQATGNKTPTIILDIDGKTFKLAMKDGRSRKYNGQIMIDDGKPYGSSTYYGRIATDGTGYIMGNAPAWVTERLAKWNADPKSIFDEARAHGRKYYNCCFCRKDLTTGASKTAGYGPVCADKWGLPWGEVAEGIHDPVEITPTLDDSPAPEDFRGSNAEAARGVGNAGSEIYDTDECEWCGTSCNLDTHECYGTRGEAHHARMMQ